MSCICQESTPYVNPVTGLCVVQSNCPEEYWGNSSSNRCEKCNSNKYATSNHDGCISQKEDCGAGKSALNSFQCQICSTVNKYTPYSVPTHDKCVDQTSCPFGFWANPNSNNIEICNRSNYEGKLNELLRGISIFQGNSCEICYLKNASAPYANPNHDGCVASFECP